MNKYIKFIYTVNIEKIFIETRDFFWQLKDKNYNIIKFYKYKRIMRIGDRVSREKLESTRKSVLSSTHNDEKSNFIVNEYDIEQKIFNKHFEADLSYGNRSVRSMQILPKEDEENKNT